MLVCGTGLPRSLLPWAPPRLISTGTAVGKASGFHLPLRVGLGPSLGKEVAGVGVGVEGVGGVSSLRRRQLLVRFTKYRSERARTFLGSKLGVQGRGQRVQPGPRMANRRT